MSTIEEISKILNQ